MTSTNYELSNVLFLEDILMSLPRGLALLKTPVVTFSVLLASAILTN
jgi:hypothetical protein